MDAASAIQQWLEASIRSSGSIAGTVHIQRDGDLYLSAAVNIPPPVMERVRHVPRGKGMAGMAQVQRSAVQTCNLQTEPPGRINPMAKLVSGQAAIAIPVFGADGQVRAVVGFAFAEEGELPPDQVRQLSSLANGLPMDA
ncbi:MAG: GAF domain-containing protein [Gemmatimonadales bacterium]